MNRHFARSTLDALEAISDLLGEQQRTRRAHTRELLDEQREARRDARAAYQDGLINGRASVDER